MNISNRLALLFVSPSSGIVDLRHEMPVQTDDQKAAFGAKTL